MTKRSNVTVEDLRAMFSEKNCSMLPDQEYISKTMKLYYICNIHPDYGSQEIMFRYLSTTKKQNICTKCKNEILYSSFQERGYELLEGQSHLGFNPVLFFRCHKHSDKGILKITWNNFLHGQGGCKYCGYERTRNALGNNFTHDFLKEEFLKRGFIYLDGQAYESARKKLKYICKNHPELGIQEISWSNFKNAVHKGCRGCGNESQTIKKRKYTIEDARIILSNEGYQLLTEDVIVNTYTLLKCICNNGHEIEVSMSNFERGQRCNTCFRENNFGSNHTNWKGGLTDISQHLRGIISDWKANSLKKCGYKCSVTQLSGNLEIHHLVPFNEIVKETLSELGLPIYKLIGEYTHDELVAVENKFRDIHNEKYPLGVCLIPNIHKLYHHIYGYKNTPEQFIDFKIKYHNGDFDSLIK